MRINIDKRILLIALLFFLLYSAPQFFRFGMYDSTMIGTTPYYHVRMAEMIRDNLMYDSLSYGGRFYTYPPLFHLILSVFLDFKFFINPLFGAAGLVLCFYLAKEMGLSSKESFIAAVVLGLIPGYAYLSGHINPRLPALVFLVASYYFLMRSQRDKNSFYYSVIFFVFSALTHTLVALTGLVFSLVIFRRQHKDLAKTYSLAAAVSILIWYLPLYLVHGTTYFGLSFYEVFIELRSGIQYFIFESGVVSDSVGFVTFLLALLALFKYRDKSTVQLRDWLFMGVIVSLAIGNRMNEQMLFPIAVLVAKALSNWDSICERLYLSSIVKNANFWLGIFALYTILLGVLSAGSLIYFPPSTSTYNAMMWINENTPEDAVVMSYWNDGHWISAIGKRKNVIDAYAEYAPEVDDRYMAMFQVMEGADVEKSLDSMRKYGVDYVYFNLINEQYCTGFAYQTRQPYFELVFSEGRSFVFKVDYSGNAVPTDVCGLFSGIKNQ